MIIDIEELDPSAAGIDNSQSMELPLGEVELGKTSVRCAGGTFGSQGAIVIHFTIDDSVVPCRSSQGSKHLWAGEHIAKGVGDGVPERTSVLTISATIST